MRATGLRYAPTKEHYTPFPTYHQMVQVMNGIWRKAYRDVWVRKLRSFLTILGIAAGVAGLVAIVSTSQNIAAAQRAVYADTSQADLSYWVWDAPDALRRSLLALPNVEEVELRATLYAKAYLGGLWRDVLLMGIEDFSDIRVNRILLQEGNYPGWDGILLDTSVRDVTDVAIGQAITIRAGTGNRDHTLTISGFALSPEYPSAEFTNLILAYVPIIRARDFLGISGNNRVLIRLRDFRLREQTAQDIARVFEKRGIPYASPVIRDPEHFEGKRELDAIIRLVYLFSGVGLVISAFLVSNTMAAIVAEGVSEIGVIKALGGTRTQILRLYLVVALIYGLTGTTLGLVGGTLGGWVLLARTGRALNIPVSTIPSPAGLSLGIIVGVAVTLFASLAPAWQAAQIPVREALGSYGITSTYGRGWVDRCLFRLSAVPPLPAMAVRNLARRKARHLLTIAFIAIATAALLAAQSTRLSVGRAVSDLFRIYNADAWVWFSEPVGTGFAASLQAVPGVTVAEPWQFTDCWVHHAPARLWGMPPNTVLYCPQMQDGEWLSLNDPVGAVVSADLAAAKGIRVGDVIEVEAGPGTRDFHVRGIVIDNSIFLGSRVAGKVFIPLSTFERLLGQQGWTSFFGIQVHDPSPSGVEAVLADIDREYRYLRPGVEAAYRDLAGAERQSRLLSVVLYSMTLLVALAGGVGVLNTLTLSVVERRREIGVLRAIGASDANLVQVYLTEGGTMGLLGGAAGIVLGYPLGLAFVRFIEGVLFQIPFLYPPYLVGSGVIFALTLAVVASLGPALAAARLPAREALRYE
ncbi:MAG: FtsX-like permease family protein [Chloroflexi bacterium]|nr:FtsX-like permease family protein [Chloroflexota bacterium]